ncbi:MAG TPA: metallophosphoesterase [Gemmatimonadales bacterium]|nr:metallophosphoesterase [Gemmatimonadales bacterium]
MRRMPLLLGLGLAACVSHLIPPAVPPIAADALTTSIFLIGDAGSPAADDPVLVELQRQATAAPRGSAILYLGDNIYPHGMPLPEAPDRPEAERRMNRQIEVALKSGIRAIFIPGNHDWFRMGKEGWDAVRRSEIYIRARGNGLAVQSPGLGCPGPQVIDVGTQVRLVLLDTQWWLQRESFPKARDSVSTCVQYTEAHVTTRLAQVLADTGGRKVIVAGHNPMQTKGEHGGYFDLKTHLFPLTAIKRYLWIPLPLLGSLYPVARANGLFGYSQDLHARANRHMRSELLKAMAAHPPLLYASGHDHNLQVFRGPVARYSIVSGAGTIKHESGAGWNRNTIFEAGKPGFMRFDLERSGRVRLSVTVIEADGPHEELAIWLTER